VDTNTGKQQVIKAMAVIRRPRDGALLVSESDDPLFQRPLGGHVEFAEYALDTVHREFGEELGQALTDVRTRSSRLCTQRACAS
jgi:8-oxo-dGTP pyrophosphatase MutT (NUDIX family)